MPHPRQRPQGQMPRVTNMWVLGRERRLGRQNSDTLILEDFEFYDFSMLFRNAIRRFPFFFFFKILLLI